MRNITLAPLFVIIFLLLMFFQACKKDPKEVIFDSFPIEKDLISHEIDWIKNIHITNSIEIYDSILLIIDFRNKHLIYTYNINSKKFLGSFGERGKGPNEFINTPGTFPEFRTEGKEIYFRLSDLGKRELYDIKLFESSESNKIKIAKTFIIPPELPLKNYHFLNDSIIAGTDMNNNGSLFFFNINKDHIVKWQKRTKVYTSVHPNHKFLINREQIWISPDKQKIVGILIYPKIINVYNNQGDFVKIIKDHEQPELHFSLPYMGNILAKNAQYYNEVLLSNEYIIVNNQKIIAKPYPKNEILIFNYSGQPIARYQLDITTFSIAVDWDKYLLYAYDYYYDKFVYYNLEGL